MLGGPRAVDLGVVGGDKISPGFKTEYGAWCLLRSFLGIPAKLQKGGSLLCLLGCLVVLGSFVNHAVYYCDFFLFRGIECTHEYFYAYTSTT